MQKNWRSDIRKFTLALNFIDPTMAKFNQLSSIRCTRTFLTEQARGVHKIHKFENREKLFESPTEGAAVSPTGAADERDCPQWVSSWLHFLLSPRATQNRAGLFTFFLSVWSTPSDDSAVDHWGLHISKVEVTLALLVQDIGVVHRSNFWLFKGGGC